MSKTIFGFEEEITIDPFFKFIPISFSWVAINPNPKGVIQFIGGALFGSFPTIFYRYFLQQLFEAGYTIIALPFRFTFDHWSVALDLLREQYQLRQKIIEKVVASGGNSQVYLNDTNYYWIGHSLGCKYILLLEILSGYEAETISELTWEKLWEKIKPKIANHESIENSKKLDAQLSKIESKVKTIYQEWVTIKHNITQLVDRETNLQGIFIRNQPSLLIAPDISDTDSAIPISQVADFIDGLGIGVKPNRQQTQSLIAASSLFSITAIFSFEKDLIAGNNRQKNNQDSDVAWLIKTIQPEAERITELPNAYHLEPHGQQVGDYLYDFPGAIIVWLIGLTFAPLSPISKPAAALFNEVRKPIIQTLETRKILETTAIDLLNYLHHLIANIKDN
jgi:hypothetical protein